ncbi:MAG: hypothetical protein HXX16_17295 [Bacteroidales bacterium]|nr:hypothetical protein [Bacteroidales bacterium]
MVHDVKLANKDVFKGGSSLIVYANPTSAKMVKGINNILLTETSSNSVGRTSGDREGTFIKVSLAKPIGSYTYGFVIESQAKLVDSKNNTNAEKYATEMMGNLVKNDIELNKNLLVVAELLEKAKAKGLNTTALQEQFNKITNQYNERQKKIQTSKLVSVKQWLNDKWDWIKSKFSKKKEEVGSISLAIAAAAGAIVAVGATALIYYSFKPDYDDSVVNLKDSALLQKAVSNLQPEEAKQLKANLEHQIDDAYNQGKTDQVFGGFFGNIKTLAIVGLAVWGFSMISNKGKK